MRLGARRTFFCSEVEKVLRHEYFLKNVAQSALSIIVLHVLRHAELDLYGLGVLDRFRLQRLSLECG